MQPYNEFLNKPYINTVKVRQIVIPPAGIVDSATLLIEELQTQKKQQESNKDMVAKLWLQRMLKIVWFDRIAQNTVPILLFKSKVLKVNPLDTRIDFLKDLDS